MSKRMNSSTTAFVGAKRSLHSRRFQTRQSFWREPDCLRWPSKVSAPNPTAKTIDLSGKFIDRVSSTFIFMAARSDSWMRHALISKRWCRYHAGGGTTSLLRLLPQPLAGDSGGPSHWAAVQTKPSLRRTVLGAHIEGPYLSMAKRGCHLKEFVRIQKKQSGNNFGV